MRLSSGVVGFIGGVVLTVAGAGIWQHFSQPGTLSRNLAVPAILHEIQGLSQLTSVKYTIQKVVGLEEQKHPFGSEKIYCLCRLMFWRESIYRTLRAMMFGSYRGEKLRSRFQTPQSKTL